MNVRKSDGSIEEFDPNKIAHGVQEAFKSVGDECQQGLIDSLLTSMHVYDEMKTSEVRRQVEEWLMDVNKKAAREYISMFEHLDGDMKELRKKQDFIKQYIEASNASTGSKYDSNANVDHKSAVSLGGELYKINNIKQNRYILTNKIKSLYSKKLADQYIKDLESHIIYRHDEAADPGKPYCVAITMYPFITDGLKPLGGPSTPPTNLLSYNGLFVNMCYAVASGFQGALATPEYLLYMDYFIRKDYGEDYLEHLNDVVDLSVKKRTLEKVIENSFQQVVHSLNSVSGARAGQTLFWNISYFDKNYFDGVFGEFRFPDGSKPNWETLSWLQKKFMKWFNKEREKYVLTYPVESMALLSDGSDIVDKEYADFTAEMWADGHSFFCYIGDSPSALSSCCFAKDTKVVWKSSIKGVQCTTLEELHNLPWDENKKNLRIMHNGSWVKGKSIKLPNRKMFKVTTYNNKEFVMTDNHINVTLNGEKPTSDLTTNDYLMFNTMPLYGISEKDEHLTYEMGFVVGAFLGDGSFGTPRTDGTIGYTVFSLNESKFAHCAPIINNALKQMNIEKECELINIHNNVYSTHVKSSTLVSFIQKWTNWTKGTYSYNKKLNLDVLQQSLEFRQGILDGWYATDGGNSNRCYTTSVKLVECMELLITSLGKQSIINISDRTDEIGIIRGEEFNRNYPLYCVRYYSDSNKRANKDVNHAWVKKNNSLYFRIKSIEEVPYADDVYCIECNDENEPYFTLPSGMITHNCRLRSDIADLQDDEHNHTTHQFSMGTASVSTGSKGVITLNLNKAIQDAVSKALNLPIGTDINIIREEFNKNKDLVYKVIAEDITEYTSRIHKYLKCFNEIVKDFVKADMLDAYRAGYITMNRQYLTVGVNGLTDAAEFLGFDVKDTPQYKEFVNLILETINICNRKDRTKECMYNTEFVPKLTGHVKPLLIDLEPLVKGQQGASNVTTCAA